MKISADRDLLTVPEVAELIGVSVPRVYEMVERGEIPHLRISHRIRIPRQALEEWLESLIVYPKKKEVIP